MVVEVLVMKVRFEIEYDTDSKSFTVEKHSDDIKIYHSGSSYLRIWDGVSLYGTLSTPSDIDETEKKMFQSLYNEGWRNLVISIHQGSFGHENKHLPYAYQIC
jgi:hypothetical protein